LQTAKRISNLPPYLFAVIDKKIQQKRDEGVDVISLGIGDPVDPTPDNVVDKLVEQAKLAENHRYPSYYGMPAFRQAIADWYKKRFGLSFNPDTEILPLIGSKEGIAHIQLAYVDPGDVVLVPDPGYPVYKTGAILAGGKPYFMPLLAKNQFVPDLQAIPKEVVAQAKLMFLNYPNNPTSAVVKEGFFDQVVEFASQNEIVVCHDFPYSEITFDGYQAPSFMATEGARDVGVEFHSLSKTYNMTGWRIGWVLGNAKVVEALGRIKSNIDSGIFNAIQRSGIEALEGPQDNIERMRDIYCRRRDLVVKTLKEIGINVSPPKATIYLWVPVPSGYSSESFASLILDKAGVVVSPGSAYGPSGEGYIRISLTVEDELLEEALRRIKSALKG
jgi:LL-diaminopimelate aminotransferase